MGKPGAAKAKSRYIRGKDWPRHPKRWNPKLVGLRFYAKTKEEFEARKEKGRALFARLRAEGKLKGGRIGVPDGFAGRKEEIAAAREEAKAYAKQKVKQLLNLYVPNEPVDPRSEEALEAALEVIRAKVDDPKTGKQVHLEKTQNRLQAARLVLDFTKSKPVVKTDNVIRTAEAFLEELGEE